MLRTARKLLKRTAFALFLIGALVAALISSLAYNIARI